MWWCGTFTRRGGRVKTSIMIRIVHSQSKSSEYTNQQYGVCNYIRTWIPLIVEISTPKPKSINFAKFKGKRTPERLFPLQNAFFNSRTLPNGFERFLNAFLNAFWTLFERFFALQNVRSVRNGKNHSGVLFSTPTPKIDLFWVWS